MSKIMEGYPMETETCVNEELSLGEVYVVISFSGR